ncbi:uncharacterized protein [Anabrus simplex]|uniref:uncharacterized protein isoform X2 n=1 Tax=Anabrus simplex TaxID=316456 RepID=UPI0035A31A2D
MGSCMSCKAGKEAYAYTTSPAVHAYPRYHSMENGRTPPSGQSEAKGLVKRNAPYSRGQATLFGFKRRPVTAPSSSAIPVLDNVAKEVSPPPSTIVNNHSRTPSHESLNSISPITSGKSSPKLARPKKDLDGNNAVRINRFGFRTPTSAAITNKVGDSNSNTIPSPHIVSHHNQEYKNVLNSEKLKTKANGRLPVPLSRETSIPKPHTTPDVNKSKVHKSFIPKPGEHHEQLAASRFTLQTTHLPKPQYPVRLSSVEADVKRTSKIAKTVANNSTRKVCQGSTGEESSSKEGSVNDDSGIGSHHSTAMSNGETDTLHGVELLDSSPTFGIRRNRNLQKPRILEMIVKGQRFDVRDLKDDDSSADDPNVITEISVISLPKATQRVNNGNNLVQSTGLVSQRSLQYHRQPGNNADNIRQDSLSTPSSDESHDDEGLGREEGEEKVFRDSSKNEKSLIEKGLVTPGSMEGEDWGHGEAMAEEFSSSSDDGHNNITLSTSSIQMNLPGAVLESTQKPRPVILTIEDPLFAAFAAEASSTLIDDEKSPVDSLISSPPTSTASEDVMEDQQRSLLQDDDSKHTDCITGAGEAAMQRSANTLSPDSPGTPTNASNSLSLSEGRDFLIDDEIADQPGLTFDDGGTAGADLVTSSGGCSSLLLSITENTTLVDSPPKPVPRRAALASSAEGSPSPARGRRISRTGSVDTLSPCESIASDDLMLDFERSEGSAFDCTADSRLDGSAAALQTLDESSLEPEIEELKDEDLKELSSAVGSYMTAAGLVTNRSRLLRSRASSTPDSIRSVEAKPRIVGGSPLKPPRQLSGTECEDGGVYLDRHTYHSICQDIVNHKTMLLKLMRHLQQAETLNPFDSSLKNGLFYNLASSEAPSGDSDESGQSSCRNPQEEIADLRRQVEFLQQQLAEKQHTVQLLQIQMTKYSNAETVSSSQAPPKETCNAATQTERIRPVSAGPSLLQSLPSDNNLGPLVSSSDTWGRRKQQQMMPGGDVVAPRATSSRLPASRTWKRSSLPQMVQPSAEPSNIPTRRLTLAGSTLPRRVLDNHSVQLNKT